MGRLVQDVPPHSMTRAVQPPAGVNAGIVEACIIVIQNPRPAA